MSPPPAASPSPPRPSRARSAPADAPPIVIAIDGPSASGKSTNARLVARALDFAYVDTGAMYRTLAWYCLRHGVDIHNPRAVTAALRHWKTRLECVEGHVRLLVNGYYPEREIRTAEVSAAVPLVAAIPKVREWMVRKQRECVQFGPLVMEGRDIGSHVFPETEFKFYLDASLAERTRRRRADGVPEDLASRDHRDSQRKTAPLMVPLGAVVVNNSGQTPAETSAFILAEIRKRLAARAAAPSPPPPAS